MKADGESLNRFPATILFCATLGAWAFTSQAAEDHRKLTMQLSSTAFAEGAPIPAKYTCDDKNLSPPLRWSGTPPGTKSIALIVDDPDAPGGTWVHWVLFDAPAQTQEFAQDLPKTQYLPGGARQGLNGFKHLGYGGPCPPPGHPHRYFFKVYALDTMLGLKPGATKGEVERAMTGHILGEGQLMATYKRK